jgi:hypothetical protein
MPGTPWSDQLPRLSGLFHVNTLHPIGAMGCREKSNLALKSAWCAEMDGSYSNGCRIFRVNCIWNMHLSKYVCGQSRWNPARTAMMWFFAVLMARSARFGSFWYGFTSSHVRSSSAAISRISGLDWLSIRIVSKFTLCVPKKVIVHFNASAVSFPFNVVRGSKCM